MLSDAIVMMVAVFIGGGIVTALPVGLFVFIKFRDGGSDAE